MSVGNPLFWVRGAEHDDGFDFHCFEFRNSFYHIFNMRQTVLTVPETFHSGKRACRWGLSTRIFDIHRCGMLRDRHCMPIPPKLFPQGVDVRNAWLASSIRVETASLPARFGLEPLKTENFGFRIDSSFMHMLLKFIFKEKSEDNSRSFFYNTSKPLRKYLSPLQASFSSGTKARTWDHRSVGTAILTLLCSCFIESQCGGFHKWGYPNSWMIYTGKSYKNWWFRGTSISGNLHVCLLVSTIGTNRKTSQI